MYALVDCNNFYVSCERVFNPKLEALFSCMEVPLLLMFLFELNEILPLNIFSPFVNCADAFKTINNNVVISNCLFINSFLFNAKDDKFFIIAAINM